MWEVLGGDCWETVTRRGFFGRVSLRKYKKGKADGAFRSCDSLCTTVDSVWEHSLVLYVGREIMAALRELGRFGARGKLAD